MQAYSDPSRESETYALPDVEIFFADDLRDDDGELMPPGFYYWFCFTGCIPDSDPFGPFKTQKEALADAQEQSRS